MTVDELRALVIECAGESVVREAEVVDPEQAHTVLANLVADWNAGKDFDPGVYDFLLGRIVLRDDDSPRQTGMLKQQAVSELQAIVIRLWITDMSRGMTPFSLNRDCMYRRLRARQYTHCARPGAASRR